MFLSKAADVFESLHVRGWRVSLAAVRQHEEAHQEHPNSHTGRYDQHGLVEDLGLRNPIAPQPHAKPPGRIEAPIAQRETWRPEVWVVAIGPRGALGGHLQPEKRGPQHGA